MEALLGKHRAVPSAFAAPLSAPAIASDSSSQSTHTGGEPGLGRQSSVTSRLPQLLGAKLGSKVRCIGSQWAAARAPGPPAAPGTGAVTIYLKVN